jgi:hypothetical protein
MPVDSAAQASVASLAFVWHTTPRSSNFLEKNIMKNNTVENTRTALSTHFVL